MSAIGDRVSQLSSAASEYGANAVISTAVNAATGTVIDGPAALDAIHGARLCLDEMTRLALIAPRTSTGGQVTSTTTANQVAFSTGIGLLASTRYACSGQP